MKRAGWLWIPWLIFALIAGVWVFYWNAVADGARKAVDEFLAAQRAGGADAACAHPTTHGFPVLLRLEYHNCGYAPANGRWRVQTDVLELNINLINPQHVIFEPKAPVEFITAEHGTQKLEADALIVSVRMQGDVLAQAGVEANNVRLDNPAREGVLSAQKLVANVRPYPRQTGDYQIALEATNATLARAVRSFETFGQDIQTLNAAIVVTQGGQLFDAPRADPLGPWREAGGRARFEALALAWGPLAAIGHGEGGLDAQNRIEGRLDIDIDKPGPPLEALSRSEGISSDAKQALQLLAAGLVLLHQEASLKVTAEDGTLKIENAPVRLLDPIY